jgi:hypothetical protein
MSHLIQMNLNLGQGLAIILVQITRCTFIRVPRVRLYQNQKLEIANCSLYSCLSEKSIVEIVRTKLTNLSLQFNGDDEVFRLDFKIFSATLTFFSLGVSHLEDDEAVLDFRSVFNPDLDRFLSSFLAGLSG